MSEKDQDQKSLDDIQTHLKSGEEPTELLLQLAWSPIETLAKKGLARIIVGSKNFVVIVLANATIKEGVGIVQTQKEKI